MLPHAAIVIALSLCASGLAVAVRARRASRGDTPSMPGDLAARCHDLVAGNPTPHGIWGVVAVIAAGALLLATRRPRILATRPRR